MPAPLLTGWFDLAGPQRAIWLDLAAGATGSAYVLGGDVCWDTSIDLDLLRQSVSLVMARHDALRLRIDADVPRQRLDPRVDPPLTIEDVSAQAGPEAAARARIDALFAEGLGLGEAPLFAVTLLRLGPSRWRFCWRCHHLIADTLSVTLLIRLWLEAYRALADGDAAALSATSSYADRVRAMLDYEAGAEAASNLAYWRGRLRDLPPPLFDAVAQPAGGLAPDVEWRLPEGDYAGFASACGEAGLTIQRGLFGLFTLAVAGRCGRQRFCLGLALHGRDYATRDMVGMLAGVLPVPVSIDTEAGIAEALGGIAASLDADFRHRRTPLDTLGRAVGLARFGRGTLVDASVSYLPPGEALSATPVGVSDARLWRGPEHAALAAHIVDAGPGGGLAVSFRFQNGRVERAWVVRLAEDFGRLLAAFVADGWATFAQLAAPGAAERATLASFATGVVLPAPSLSLASLFALAARRQPDAAAVIEAGVSLSCTALDAWSDRVAASVAALAGEVAEPVIGVCLPRSARTVASLVGILKAGAVYLPLDPAYPPGRLAHMLADAGAVGVITDATTDALLPATLKRLGEAAGRFAPASIDPSHLAYIVYTSGSTGLPKGVAVSHASAAALAQARLAHDPIGPGARILASISVGFDVSIGQLLLPLLSGAAIVIAPDLRTLDAEAFWSLLVRERVSHINSVPSFFASVIDAAPARTSLVRLMLGGEALSAGLVRRLRAALPGVAIVNMYGPTEATIDATAYPVPEEADAAVLPIGRPLPGYSAHVLDARMAPVPIGVEGELCLGGVGLARGYVGKPGLTASRFVAAADGSRLYRTGDQARWRSDGVIEFLGRVDRQVKIRGFRIEPGEIEAVLTGACELRQAAVVARTDAGGAVRLVAYVVGETAGLREALGRHLPAHMIPAAFVSMDALPLTVNGKLDEAALPAGEVVARAVVGPRDATEAALLAIWRELLGREEIGVEEDFFAAGGDSLMAIRFAAAVRTKFGRELPLRMMFERPRIADLAAVLKVADEVAVTAARPRPARLPLSFSQERLWFLDQLHPGTSAYVIPVALRIDGALDADRLGAAFAWLVQRHESLRTVFVERDGAPWQRILPAADTDELPACFAVEDWSDRDASERVTQVEDACSALVRTPFHLAAGPLLKARLLRLDEARHVLLLAMHHIVADGWSMEIVIREVLTFYAGGAEALPPLPLQYADYALTQRDDLTDERQERLVAHWRAALADAPFALDLPIDRPRPTAQRFLGAACPITISPALTIKLRDLAASHGVTLFVLLLAAFQALLARWCGRRHVVVGVPVANRAAPLTQGLIGFLVNTLALHGDCPAGLGFAALIDATAARMADAQANQDLPFERLVQALRPPRDLAHHPIFQVALAWQTIAPPAAEGLSIEPVSLPTAASKFDLTLTIGPAGDGLAGAFEYDRDLFEPETIKRLFDRFVYLLDQVTDAPETTLGALAIVTEPERATLASFATGAVLPAPSLSLASLFALAARRQPDAAAVIEAGVSLSYTALDAWSDRVAASVAALAGEVAEPVIGVCLPRSARTVASLVGILKAGAVYLPLDPAYPPGRLAHMLADCGAVAVITDATTDALLPATLKRLGEAAGRFAPASIDPSHLAYIVYTSGSTGLPKGVAVSHASAAALAQARLAHDPIGPGARILASISVGFDVSIGQLLLPLLSGAAIVIAPDLRTLDAEAFWSLLVRERVSHINSVPSFFASVIDAAPARTSLVRLMLGGEALSAGLVRRLRAALPGVAIVNMYGPTEATIDATAYPVPEEADAAVLPIGRPLPGYSAHVLDARMAPVPIGVEGELCLGGVGLARGYVGKPGLTASRFVAAADGSRLYRTGDQARWRSDGVIEFLGRVDRQVKIRGFRIEPGEIEAVLTGACELRQAAVVARTDAGGAVRLVAYVVGETAGLREALGRHLPAHMIPAAFVSMDALPLTVNGKLDEAALPAGEAPAREIEPPVGPREVLFVRLFASLTGTEPVGRHDDFFALGGDSIGVIRLVALARQEGGLSLQVRDVFAGPTPAALAQAATEASGKLIAVEATGTLAPTPLQAAWLADARPLQRFHQLVALQPPAGLTAARIEVALQTLVAHHDALRLRLDPGDRLVIPAASEMAPILTVVADGASFRDAAASLPDRLDLAGGRLMAAVFDAQAPALAICIHHFAVDGVSWRILIEDLVRLVTLTDAPLAPVAVPFRGWTEFLHGQAQAVGVDREEWRRRLEPVPPPRSDFTDPARPNIEAYAASHAVTLTAPLTRRVLAAPATWRAEIADVLLAGLVAALRDWQAARYGNEATSWPISVEGHGREPGDTGFDLTRTVGWFTTQHPILVTLAPDETAPGAILRRVKSARRRLLRERTLGYGILRHIARDPALQAPEPVILFNHLGRADEGGRAGWSALPFTIEGCDDRERTRDPVLIEVTTIIAADRCLHARLTYPSGRFKPAAIAALATAFETALASLAEPVSVSPHACLVPEQFSLADGLDDGGLASLIDACPSLEDVVTLTPLQGGLAFESLLAREAGRDDPYHVQAVLVLEGAPDPARLRDAFAKVLAAHPILRLRLPEAGLAAGLGVIAMATSSADFAVMPGMATSDSLLDADRRAPFDLGGQLIRARLAAGGPERHLLLIANHHALLDGWSMPLLLRDLLLAYEGRTLPVSAAWHDHLARLAARDRDAATRFWRDDLAALGLEAGAVSVPAASASGPLAIDLDAAFAARLTTASRAGGVTLASLVFAGWALLLARLRRGGPEILLGITRSGREDGSPGVGLFIETTPVRVFVDEAARVGDWLAALHGRLGAQAGQGWIGLPAIRAAAGLGEGWFEALFVFENFPGASEEDGRTSDFRIVSACGNDGTHYRLSLAAAPLADGLRLRLGHDAARVDAASAAGLLARLPGVLRALCDLDGRLGEVGVLDEPERATLASFATGAVLPAPSLSLASLFALAARRQPDAAAVIEAGVSLSYTALDAWSDRVAASVAALAGEVAEPVIGVCLPRSARTVASLVGILKAGAVYLPLDPAYPPGRLAHMLADAGAVGVITDATTDALLPATLKRLGEAAGRLAPASIDPSHLAYIVYTSGSTGLPKGVAVSHASAAALAQARLAHDPIGPGARILASISVGFDVSIGQLLLPLLSGAAIVIAPDLRTLDAEAFWSLLVRERVSHINSVPSFFASVIDAAPARTSLVRLMLGGEALSAGLVRRLRAALPGVAIVNMYGPTEATIDATAYPVPEEADAAVLPIGRPLPGYSAHVLDARMAPVPIGVEGELCLGGVGLARGYVGKPGLTASRFVAAADGSRLYRTGDQARWRSDGVIEFLGRVDRQVKIRGFRIEPGEIEAVLTGACELRQAAVVARTDAGGAVRLVAYVVGETVGLREALGRHLPAHMIPAAFVSMDALPLTVNGKLDEAALPAGEVVARAVVGPRDATEAALLAIWRELLGREEIGVEEDFFAAGGDSLMALRLVARCRVEFGAELPLATLLRNRTIETLAVAMRSGQAEDRLVPLREGGDGPPLICVHPLGGTVFCFLPLAEAMPQAVAIWGIQAAGLFAGERPPETIEAMGAFYAAAIRARWPDGPYRLLGYSFGGLAAYEAARCLGAEGKTVERLVLMDTIVPGVDEDEFMDGSAILAMLANDLGLDGPAPETVAELYLRATAAELVPPGFTIADAERLVGLHSHHGRLVERYRPKRLAGPLLQIRAMLGRRTPPPDWSRLIDGAVATVDFDTDHRGLVSAAMAASVAAAIVGYDAPEQEV